MSQKEGTTPITIDVINSLTHYYAAINNYEKFLTTFRDADVAVMHKTVQSILFKYSISSKFIAGVKILLATRGFVDESIAGDILSIDDPEVVKELVKDFKIPVSYEMLHRLYNDQNKGFIIDLINDSMPLYQKNVGGIELAFVLLREDGNAKAATAAYKVYQSNKSLAGVSDLVMEEFRAAVRENDYWRAEKLIDDLQCPITFSEMSGELITSTLTDLLKKNTDEKAKALCGLIKKLSSDEIYHVALHLLRAIGSSNTESIKKMFNYLDIKYLEDTQLYALSNSNPALVIDLVNNGICGGLNNAIQLKLAFVLLEQEGNAGAISAATKIYSFILRNLDGALSIATNLRDIIQKGNNDLVEKFLSIGGDVNTQDELGNTLLHNAILAQNTDAMKILIQHGANFLLTNNFGENAADLARSTAINMLEQYHAGSAWHPPMLVNAPSLAVLSAKAIIESDSTIIVNETIDLSMGMAKEIFEILKMVMLSKGIDINPSEAAHDPAESDSLMVCTGEADTGSVE